MAAAGFWVFWICLCFIAYTYLLYPLLLWLFTFWKRRPIYEAPQEWPNLSLVIAAYNEEAVIADKLNNTLAIDYPGDRLQIVVVSDASDDGTDEMVKGFAERGVVLHRLDARGGKTTAQNVGVGLSTGEILVFSDANSMYDEAALKQLVLPFADSQVGCVCGELRYVNPEGLGAGKGEGFYWRYEQFLKGRESLLSSLVGANGSIYAVRRELFDELVPEIISDFIMPIRVVRKGAAARYAPAAIAFGHSGQRFGDEFRRRTRIIARSLYGLWTEIGVLNPFSNGLFAFQVLSHKVVRWLVPVFLLGMLAGNIALGQQHVYREVLHVHLVFYALALIGNLSPTRLGRSVLFYIPAYFCAINLGALLGLWCFLSGQRYASWQPVERGPEGRR